MCDEDGDDLLTADEIAHETELWLTSDVTEHGNIYRRMDEL